MKNMISIIVPIYNSERYLEKCINSILKQTYKNIEIILVDDGSKDHSLDICNRLSKNDNRISVFHKENSGVSSTRNYGLTKVHGEYIAFVDSDDVVDERYCENLIENLIENDADLSIVGVSTNALYYNLKEPILKLNKRDIYIKFLFDMDVFGYPVNKLYKKSIIDKIKDEPFEEKIYWGEDLLFNIKYLNCCNDNIVLQKNKLYLYIQNDLSRTNKKTLDEKALTLIECCKKVINTYNEVCQEDTDYAWLFFFYNIMILKKRKANKMQSEMLRNEAKIVIKKINQSNVISLKEKFKVNFEYRLPHLFNLLNGLVIKIKNSRR